MGFIGQIFAEAVKITRESDNTSLISNGKFLPPIYVDCGNTLFFKKDVESSPSDTQQTEDVKHKITANAPLLNFIIAVKEAGFAVQLMSDEPLRYLDILHEELTARGKPEYLFEDDHGLTILRKQLIDDSMEGLILIDNDVFSVPVQIKRRFFLNDPRFMKALEDFKNFETAALPEFVNPTALWTMAPKVMFQ